MKQSEKKYQVRAQIPSDTDEGMTIDVTCQVLAVEENIQCVRIIKNEADVFEFMSLTEEIKEFFDLIIETE